MTERAGEDEMDNEGTAQETDVVWCVFRRYDLDSIFAVEELAWNRYRALTGRGVAGIQVEPYTVNTKALPADA